MLFSPYPKTKREELFDRERELKELEEAVKRGERLILLLGLRRLGKSSLLNVALNELTYPSIKVDVRKTYSEFSSVNRYVIGKMLLSGMSGRKKLVEEAKLFLERVKGVSVSGLKLEITSKDFSITELLEALNEYGEKAGRVIIAFDEAQYLRFGGATRYDGILAYAIDNLENLTFILTGSEVGLLFDFLKFDNPEAPLFGRYHHDVILDRFSPEISTEFLRKGFEEANFKVSRREIEGAVGELDGIPGWLALYGYMRVTRDLGHEEAMNEVLREAKSLVQTELSRLFAYSPRYRVILKAVALGYSRWKDIKDYLTLKLGYINDSNFSKLLENLVKSGYVEKKEGKYTIPDPVLQKVFREL
ncbi:ATPase [Thermococcus guaymasensis DSM 11113]|uniref:ATPase n=1 Tax=Thermococcus guaymasensis DSM 11113 TaxID=1432656 RepID=A0A0X1KJ46_9EURY|nr:ATP-binding protein [Thermococcus guaymasensis]AJC71276.1 ATPase [Thermococcus guaymasensis DSM 11113]